MVFLRKLGMRLCILLFLLTAILTIGCSTNNVTNEDELRPSITAPIPTQIVVQPTPLPVVSPSQTVPLLPSEENTEAVWQEYVNDAYGFRFQYPSIWSLVEEPNMISLVYKGESITLYIRFRHPNEEVSLILYGGAAGDFIDRGQILFMGSEIEKTVLYFREVDKEFYYNVPGGIKRGDIEFSLALKSNRSYENAIIPEPIQAAAEEVLATFTLLGEEE